MGTATVIGAYATQPAEPAAARRFLLDVLALPGCDGLEIPFGSAAHERDRDWLRDSLPPGGRHVFTLVAATMEALGRDGQWGPASGSGSGRSSFLDLLAEARDAVAEAAATGQRILAVQVQSAPRGTADPGPSADALRESLAAAASWDWCGAALTVEHCDSARPGRPVAKGFLTLADELTVLADLRAARPRTRVGLTINWGRSAIDTGSAAGVDAQIAAARRAGLLTGLMFSGTTAVPGPFGPAWSDSHAPLHDDDPELGEPTSLLTGRDVRSARAAAGVGLRYEGLKIGVRPRDAPVERRLAHLSRLLAAVRDAAPAE